MRLRLLTAVTAAAALLLASCAPESPPLSEKRLADQAADRLAADAKKTRPAPKPIRPVQFNDIKLPGTAVDAKAAGFTDCDIVEDGTHMDCRNADARFLGLVPLEPVELRLEPVNHFLDSPEGPIPNETVDGKGLHELTYGRVTYTLSGDLSCAQRGQRRICAQNDPAKSVRGVLAKNGWIKLADQHGEVDSYLHPRIPLEIELAGRADGDVTVLVRPVDPVWSKVQVNTMIRREAGRQALKAQMKAIAM